MVGSIYFWRNPDLACREFEVRGADVEVVLDWADRNRCSDETYTIGVLTHPSQVVGTDVILTRITGSDPSRNPLTAS